jgi:hypothetical protein
MLPSKILDSVGVSQGLLSDISATWCGRIVHCSGQIHGKVNMSLKQEHTSLCVEIEAARFE